MYSIIVVIECKKLVQTSSQIITANGTGVDPFRLQQEAFALFVVPFFFH